MWVSTVLVSISASISHTVLRRECRLCTRPLLSSRTVRRRYSVGVREMVSSSTLTVCESSSTLIGPPCSILPRSEEHTSELQSRGHLVCRLLLDKNKHQPRLAPDL